MKSLRWLAVLLLVVIGTSAFAQGLPLGPSNVGAQRYNYGPSVLYDQTDAKWKVWWCGPRVQNGGVMPGDAIWYSETTDLITWSTSTVVFQPSSSGWDSFHTCDPSVLRNVVVGGVLRPYVLYYTGADTTYGNGDWNGQIGVAVSSNGTTWTRLAKLTLGCETTTNMGCQHFSAVKLRNNAPDPGFGGRFVATVSQSKNDDSTGTYVFESPDGLTWWGNAGVPNSPGKRLLFPNTFGSQYMNAGDDLMYDAVIGRYLLTFTAAETDSGGFAKEYVFTVPAHWYGGMNSDVAAVKLADYAVFPYTAYVPGFFRAGDGYRPSAPYSMKVHTMTSNRNIRVGNTVQETQLVWLYWF